MDSKQLAAILDDEAVTTEITPEKKCLSCAKPASKTLESPSTPGYMVDLCDACYPQVKVKFAEEAEHEKQLAAKPQQQVAATTAPKRTLNAAQKKVLKNRKAKQQEIAEENWGGPCKGGCGKMNQGEYTCYDCRTKKQRETLALKPGETEIYRGNIGNVEDRVIKQIVVREAESIDLNEVTWIWFNKIPVGTATWIMGQPNNAKSLMSIEIVACVTTGRNYPDGAVNTLPPSKVLMYCGEDSLDKVVMPRLKAAGADTKMVGFLDRKSFRTIAGDNDAQARPLDLMQDLDELIEFAKQHPEYKMIVADPITGIFGDANINKNEEANPVLEKLIDFCEATGIAFVGILHVPKRTTNSAIEKIAGGSAVGGTAKSAFMLSRDPDSDDVHDHILSMVKWNYASEANGMKYKTVPAVVDWKGRQIKTAKIKWGEVTTTVADDVLIAQNSKNEKKDRTQDKCDAWLLAYLGDTPKRSKTVYDDAAQAGFASSTVKRSVDNIKGQHIDGRKVGKGAGWWMAAAGADFPAPKEEKLIALAVDEGL